MAKINTGSATIGGTIDPGVTASSSGATITLTADVAVENFVSRGWTGAPSGAVTDKWTITSGVAAGGAVAQWDTIQVTADSNPSHTFTVNVNGQSTAAINSNTTGSTPLFRNWNTAIAMANAVNNLTGMSAFARWDGFVYIKADNGAHLSARQPVLRSERETPSAPQSRLVTRVNQ